MGPTVITGSSELPAVRTKKALDVPRLIFVGAIAFVIGILAAAGIDFVVSDGAATETTTIDR